MEEDRPFWVEVKSESTAVAAAAEEEIHRYRDRIELHLMIARNNPSDDEVAAVASCRTD